MKPFQVLALSLAALGLPIRFAQAAEDCIVPPVNCPVTSAYGPRYDPVKKDYSKQFHKGTDFGCPINTTVRAAVGGKVLSTNWSNDAGNLLIIQQGDRIYKYMHNERISVSAGQTVSQLQDVSKSGNTGGRTTGPHLHFQVEKAGVGSVDPYSMFCSKPSVKDGVLQGKDIDAHDDSANPDRSTAAPLESSGSPFDTLGLEGSFRQILADAIGSRTFNPDYTRQISTLSAVKLYSELSFVNTLRLRIKEEAAGHKERSLATHAMLQILIADKALKSQLEAQRGVATSVKN